MRAKAVGVARAGWLGVMLWAMGAGVIGCAADSARVGFTRAEFVRGEGSGRCVTATLTGDQLEQLVEFFPGVGSGEETYWKATQPTGLHILLYREDGRVVDVRVSMDLESWSEGQGSHWLDGGFGKFLTEAMPPVAGGDESGQRGLR